MQRGDKMRKFVFILVVFMITVFAVDSAFGSAEKSEVKIHYNQVRVLKGETYWDIAGRYKSDGMTRKEYVEYIIQDYNKPMGVATYTTSADMPEKLRKALPDIEELKKIL